jgi:hypothetical protein
MRQMVKYIAPSSEKAHTLDNNNRCRYRMAFAHLIHGIQVKFHRCGHNKLVHTLGILLVLDSSRSHIARCHWVAKNNVRITIILEKTVHTWDNSNYYYWGMLFVHLVGQN